MKKESLPTGVRKVPGGYQARISVGGVQQSVGVYPSKTAARDARSLALAQHRLEMYVPASGAKMRFDEWANQWLDLREGGNTKTQSFLRSRIRPRWAFVRLGEITPVDVQRWVNVLRGEGLAPQTVNAIYSTFKRMMQDAVDYDIISKTPCRNITLPKKKTLKQKVPLTAAQIMDLESKVGGRYAAMVHLGAWAGLRWGECAGLQWSDVDLEKGLLHIQRSGRSTTTKSGESRYVALSPAAVQVLRAHRRDYGRAVWVFTTPVHGVQLRYEDFRRRVWLPAVAGLDPKPTFHDLRHSYATQMVKHGVDPKVLAQQIGHHAASFTLDVYGLPRQDSHAVTVAAIQAAMRETGTTAGTE